MNVSLQSAGACQLWVQGQIRIAQPSTDRSRSTIAPPNSRWDNFTCQLLLPVDWAKKLATTAPCLGTSSLPGLAILECFSTTFTALGRSAGIQLRAYCMNERQVDSEQQPGRLPSLPPYPYSRMNSSDFSTSFRFPMNNGVR